VKKELAAVAEHVEQLDEINDTLDPLTGPSTKRRRRFRTIEARLRDSRDPILQHMAKTMKSFAPGLFSGGDDPDLPLDNLDLERSFRLPKGHERRIHGHAHAGVRIVHHGPCLLLVLGAHVRHPGPFSADELAEWIDAPAPPGQLDCRRRRRLMTRARSAEKRPLLLAELERRYRHAAQAS
jgi:hypothetical protein